MHPFERRSLLRADSAAPERKETLAERIERWTKVGVPLLGALYVLGFVVSAFHLAKYGVSPLGFVRTQYLLAGMWALIPFATLVATIALMFVAIRLEVEDAQRERRKRPAGGTPPGLPMRFGSALMHVFGVLAALGGFVWISAMSWRWVPFEIASRSGGEIWSIVWPVPLYALGIAFGLAAAMGKAAYASAFWRWSSAIGGTALMTVFTIGYLGCFAARIYPIIPSSLGGGKPLRVTIVFKTPPGSAAVKQSVDLLAATEKTLIVLNDGTASEISRDLVGGVIMARAANKQP